MMFLVSAFQIVEGLIAIFDRSYYQVTSSHLVVHVSYAGWAGSTCWWGSSSGSAPPAC
jgi:hypothetical protein